MNTTLMQSRYGSVIKQRNALFFSAMALLAVVVLLTLTVLQQQTRVVLVPSRVADGMVAFGAQDNRYIEAIALDVVYAVYNVTPSSLVHSRDVIERVTTAQHREHVLEVFDETSKDYERRKITTAFFPITISYQLANNRVVVEGQLKTFLNTTLVSTASKTVAVSFAIEAGSARVSGIKVLQEDQS